MKQLNRELEKAIESALRTAQLAGDLPSFEIPKIPVSAAKREGHGDFSYPAMALAKLVRMKPMDVAMILRQYIEAQNIDFLDQIAVVPPGYANFIVSNEFLRDYTESIVRLSNRIHNIFPSEDFHANLTRYTANIAKNVIRQNLVPSSLFDDVFKARNETIASISKTIQKNVQQNIQIENVLGNVKATLPKSLDLTEQLDLTHTSRTLLERVELFPPKHLRLMLAKSLVNDATLQQVIDSPLHDSIITALGRVQEKHQLALSDLTHSVDLTSFIPNLELQTTWFDQVFFRPPSSLEFSLSDEYLERQIDAIIAEGDEVFQLDIGKGKKAQVEFVSANPSGPITIGHTRGAVIGDAMARLLEAAGYQVQREYYYNNAGNQMMVLGKSLMLRYLQQLGDDVTFPASYYQGAYLIEVAADLVEESGDSLRKETWEAFKDIAENRMFDWINRSLASIDIKHDDFYNETSLFESELIWQVLNTMRENGHIYESTHWEGADDDEIADVKAKGYQPATWFRSTTFGDEKDRVMVKSDGAPTYTLPDIAYHCDKLERGFDIAVNVLGTDHFSQAAVVKHGIRAMNMNPDPIHVIFIQMVRAVRWNEELGVHEAVKQSKRAGDFDTLDDLVEMTSADAVRYHMLARSPNSQLDFDVDQVIKQTNENPVYYIQNAYVRCAGIFREAEERGLNDDEADLSLLGENELAFIRKSLELGNVIEQAVINYEPHKIAFYAHELAAVFHPIYDKVRVLHSEVPPNVAKARLRFYRAAAVVFYRVLQLMGMSAPDRM